MEYLSGGGKGALIGLALSLLTGGITSKPLIGYLIGKSISNNSSTATRANNNNGLVSEALGSGTSEQIMQIIKDQQAFNSAEAQKERDWQTTMSNSAVQRQVADIKAAGLNPWLALNGGGVNGAPVSAGSSASDNSAGAMASVLSAQMNGAAKLVSSIFSSAASAFSRVLTSGFSAMK